MLAATGLRAGLDASSRAVCQCCRSCAREKQRTVRKCETGRVAATFSYCLTESLGEETRQLWRRLRIGEVFGGGNCEQLKQQWQQERQEVSSLRVEGWLLRKSNRLSPLGIVVTGCLAMLPAQHFLWLTGPYSLQMKRKRSDVFSPESESSFLLFTTWIVSYFSFVFLFKLYFIDLSLWDCWFANTSNLTFVAAPGSSQSSSTLVVLSNYPVVFVKPDVSNCTFMNWSQW